jgi:hypothetical protein
VADDDHVAGGGDGEELGQALHYAQHEGDKQGVRLCHVSDLLVIGLDEVAPSQGRPMMEENRAGNQ